MRAENKEGLLTGEIDGRREVCECLKIYLESMCGVVRCSIKAADLLACSTALSFFFYTLKALGEPKEY